jgi:hypothetical protein
MLDRAFGINPFEHLPCCHCGYECAAAIAFCPSCGERANADEIDCPDCEGEGSYAADGIPFWMPQHVTCSACEGRGAVETPFALQREAAINAALAFAAAQKGMAS